MYDFFFYLSSYCNFFLFSLFDNWFSADGAINLFYAAEGFFFIRIQIILNRFFGFIDETLIDITIPGKIGPRSNGNPIYQPLRSGRI